MQEEKNVNYNGKEHKKDVGLCITESLCYIAEINTTIVTQLYFN